MRLTRRLPDSVRTVDVQYLWHWTCNKYWNFQAEEQTDYNRTNGIRTHTDLILHFVRTHATRPAFKSWFEPNYKLMDAWSGWFGTMSVMKHDFLVKMQLATGFCDMAPFVNTRRLRCAVESIFSLAVQFTLGSSVLDSLDGLYFDGVNHNGFVSRHFSKVCFGR
jgi:hypothetical protein